MIEFQDQSDLIACYDDEYLKAGEIRDIFLGSIKKNSNNKFCFFLSRRGLHLTESTMLQLMTKVKSLNTGGDK